jgi:hypothetical protein
MTTLQTSLILQTKQGTHEITHPYSLAPELNVFLIVSVMTVKLSPSH